MNRRGVNRPFRTSFARLSCLAGFLLVPTAKAQHVFVVLEDGSPQIVRDVRYGHAQVEVDGELHGANGTQFALRDAAIYGPGLITISDFRVRSRYLEVDGAPTRLNFELEIRGYFHSASDLEQCFLVLDITSGGDKGVAFAELPNFEAGKAERVELNFPLKEPLERGNYNVHFFSRGFEILHSKMKAAYIEEQKQKTTDFLRRPSDQPVRLVHAVKPRYPDNLPDETASGSAKVRCRIDTEGAVADVTLIECSHPAFGEAALAAVRQWRFEPAIKNHEPVTTTVDIPFEFKPPAKSDAVEADGGPTPTP